MTDRHLNSAPRPGIVEVNEEARELVELLSPQSTIADRLKALGKCGIDKNVLQQNGVMEQSVYEAYVNGQKAAEATPLGEVIMDDVRMVARHMLWNGVSPEQTGAVLTMPLTEFEDEELIGKSLLEATTIDPMAALTHVVCRYGYFIPGQAAPVA